MKTNALIIRVVAGWLFLIFLAASCSKDADLNLLEADPSQATFSTRDASALTPMELLGKEIFFDKISSPNNMSCATCHDPDFGFTGPVPGINKKHGIYPGAVKSRFANRKPPTAAYATFSPVLYYDETEGLVLGGNFWDGRATGERLGSPAADQALGPFLSHLEQNMPSKEAVLQVIAESKYAGLWEDVWGEPPSWATTQDVEANYDRVGLSIAAYEASSEVNAFSSKYDKYLAGEAEFTDQEIAGMGLFFGDGQCALCHPPPLFTDFSYDNLGVPRNPDNPWYTQPFNPDGYAWVDYGLGGFLESVDSPFWNALAEENMGKHKVPTLRNVDKRPGPGATKAYMHNGVFKSLEEVVHFYNTRDVKSWPAPEVAQNVNTEELGDLGLSPEEEAAIVAFMRTLSDGY